WSLRQTRGGSLSRLVLVVGHAAAHSGGRETKELNAPDAAPSLLLDRPAHGQSRVLGRFSIARSAGGDSLADLASARRSYALPDRRQDHPAEKREENAAGAQDADERIRPLCIRLGSGVAHRAMGSVPHPSRVRADRSQNQRASKHSVSPDTAPL